MEEEYNEIEQSESTEPITEIEPYVPKRYGTKLITARQLEIKEAKQKFSQELYDTIIDTIATTTKSVRKICTEDFDISYGTFLRWKRDDGDLYNQYVRAVAERAELRMETIEEVSSSEVAFGDMANANMKKLYVESTKWIMEKEAPKKYGKAVEDKPLDGSVIVSEDQFARLMQGLKEKKSLEQGFDSYEDVSKDGVNTAE